jgi:hypothetical protein
MVIYVGHGNVTCKDLGLCQEFHVYQTTIVGLHMEYQETIDRRNICFR